MDRDADDTRFIERYPTTCVLALFALAGAVLVSYTQVGLFAPILAALK